MENNDKELSAKRLRFIDEYMIDLNGTQAAIRAGYPENSARSIASEYLAIPDIKAEIDIRKAELAKKYEIKKEYIIDHLYELIRRSTNDQDRQSVLKALDMLNKMAGNYSQTITNINIEQPLFPED